MKSTFVALAAAILASSGAHAATSITALPGSSDLSTSPYGSSTDAFDVNQGGTVTGSSAVIFNADHAIGGVTPGAGEPYSVDFNGAGAGFISFQTPGPVSITGFNLIVGGDGDTPDSREFSTISLSGSSDGVTFSSLGSFDFTNQSYTAYGSNVLKLTSTFAAKTDQFFRIDAISKAQGTAQGGRVIEVDAISGGAAGAVPEPASWAMMIGGFGLVGGMMRAARRSDERFTRKLRKLASA